MPNQLPKETLFLHNSTMGLGAWAWGDRFFWNYGHSHTEKDVEAAFQASLEAGINLIDTAEVYAQGRSERLLGLFIKNCEKPVFVATKFFPFPWRFKKQALLTALRHSLERLNLEQVDLYQLHWPPYLSSIETLTESLAEAVKAGLTRTVGVSNFNINQLLRAYTVLSRHDIPLAANQVEYHLLNREIERDGLLAHCKDLNIRVIAYSPLAQGLLTGKYSTDNPPSGFRGRQRAWALSKMRPLIQLMSEIGQDQNGKTLGQVALNWVICKGALPIPGAKNALQAEQNAGALGWRLTPEQVSALDMASDKIVK